MGILDWMDSPAGLGSFLNGGSSGPPAAFPPTPPDPAMSEPYAAAQQSGAFGQGARQDPWDAPSALAPFMGAKQQPDQRLVQLTAPPAPNAGMSRFDGPSTEPPLPPAAGGAGMSRFDGSQPGGGPAENAGMSQFGPMFRPDDAARLPTNAAPTAMAAPVPPMALPPPAAGPAAPVAPGAPGATPSNIPANRLTNALGIGREGWAGLGRGLTAVGNSGGKRPLAAFASGAGAALEGNAAEAGKQDEFAEKKKTNSFNQMSTAFKDQIAAQQANNQEDYKKAQAKYLEARAKSLSDGGTGTGKGTNAWQNTPYGQVMQVEGRAQQWAESREKSLRQQWRLNGTPEKDQNAQLEQLAQARQQYTDNLYKTAGIDPKAAENIKTMGMKPENPFDTRKMTAAQFHAQVPLGAWYIDGKGVRRQRTVAPPGQKSEGETPAIPTDKSAAAPTYDDYTAMGEAA